MFCLSGNLKHKQTRSQNQITLPLLAEVMILFVVSEIGTRVDRCGCTEHMDITAGELSATDAPLQVYLAVAIHVDTESDAARGKKEQSKFPAFKIQAFILLTAHYRNHIVHQGVPISWSPLSLCS